MSEARKCDVCGSFAVAPFTGWSIVWPDGKPRTNERERADLCSEECLHVYHDSLRVHHQRNELMTL
jgi:hypothetical protein